MTKEVRPSLLSDIRNVSGYGTFKIITAIRHKGLRRLHETDDSRGAMADHTDKLRRILCGNCQWQLARHLPL
jgi:ribosomal protein S27AE